MNFKEAAAVACNRAGLGVEHLIENGDDLFAGNAIRQLGEASQIGRPQHRGNGPAGAAWDLARQDARAGQRAEIGFQHVFRDHALAVHIDCDREPLGDAGQLGNLAIGETARPVGHIGGHVVGVRAIGAADRKREIFRGAARLEFMQHRKVEPGPAPLEAAARVLAAAAHPQRRICWSGNEVCDLVHYHDLLGLRGGPPPEIGGAEKLRMAQRAAMKADAQDRDAGGKEAPSIFVDRARRGGDAARFADQPFGDGVDRVVGRPLGGRPLDHLSGDDGAALDDECPGGCVSSSLDHYSSTTTPPSLRRAVPIATPSQRPGRKMRRETGRPDVNEKVTNSKTRAAQSRPLARSAVTSLRSA